jgi:hypothetical protein
MAHKEPRVLKARAMVAVKAAVTVNAMAVVDKSSVAIRALTTGVTAKAVPHPAVHVLKAVAQPVVVKAVKVVRTAAGTMATNCHATLIRSKPHSLHAWTCPTASPSAPAASPTRPAPASTALQAVAAAMVVVVTVAVATAAAMVVAEAEAASVADQPPAP